MKLFTSLLAVLLLTATLHAQVVITSLDMPVSGDTLRYSTGIFDSLTLATYAQTGAGISWDFSQLEAQRQDIDEYVAASQTPYGFFFLGGNNYGLQLFDTVNLGGMGSISQVYDFFSNSATAFEAEGRGLTFSGFPIPAFYSDKDEIYQFPLNFGDRDSSTFDFTTAIPFIGSLTTTGYRINDVDGYGMVMTPYDTVQCIRVVTDVVSQDSVNIATLGGFAIPNHTRTIKWLSNTERFPMVEVSGNVVAGIFAPTQVRYRDRWRDTDNSNPLAPDADFEADNTQPEATLDTVVFFPLVLPLPTNTYTWTISPSTHTFVNGTDATSEFPEVVFDAPGAYDVSMNVVSLFGSADTTKLSYINALTVSAPQVLNTERIQLFPNPVTHDVLHVRYDLQHASPITIRLLDLNGRLIRVLDSSHRSSGAQTHDFRLPSALQGVYLIDIQASNSRHTQPIIVR